ncbi:DHHC palmitoyltransferase-domain-containing protein [Dactylonectria macrodidyma]|uniref:Palmitoyltransferase PFA4 n=1 Tax=Dactylonectria macrodidyma TaxID=307937 RepID=A0A9P9F6A1_9HYPO|nr:DHHC palmitoyltransferase-domain-containing protein [Dactylonectria macrodidyma]
MAGFNDVPFIRGLAVPSVCVLIFFLGYFSQLVFHFSTLDPGPPSREESFIFNTLLALLWLTYYRAITVDPGRYVFDDRVLETKGRWCNKCAAPKPPRAHHCRHCARCVPKMDHHCPWTSNCVSMTTFPHFLRFLIFTNLSLWYLAHLLWLRFAVLWEHRRLPAYLGPSLAGLSCLAILSLMCSITSLALLVMLVTSLRSWVINQTMIEGWEQERHETIADRGGKDWWDVVGPDGEKIRFEKLEFPYDVGFFKNMAQAMGTSNILLWFWPLAGNPKIAKNGRGSGWDWEENGFNRIEGLWPPLDPEKIRRSNRGWPAARRDFSEELRIVNMSPDETKAEFKKRQVEDERRKRMLLAELEEVDDYDMYNDEDEDMPEQTYDGMSGWTNSDGDRLRDFGVDEESDSASGDDEDVPLAELMRRRKVLRKYGDEG